MTEDSLTLGYNIETRLGDQAAAERYRRQLLERYPNAATSGRPPGQGTQ